jgi:hypothetical protein
MRAAMVDPLREVYGVSERLLGNGHALRVRPSAALSRIRSSLEGNTGKTVALFDLK